MTRTPFIITLVAAAALAGCNKQSHTIVAGPDVEDNEPDVTANTPVALPPSIASSKIYRCADNKVLYVDWLSDQKSANIRTDEAGTPTQVTAAAPGQPMTAPGGYSISGQPGASTAKIAIPGHAEQSCKA